MLLCVSQCVNASETIRFRNISSTYWWIFAKLLSLVDRHAVSTTTLSMGMSAVHCQGISECLESGHPGSYLASVNAEELVYIV